MNIIRFFLQAFFSQISTQGGPGRLSLSEIYENHFIPSIRQSFFNQFLERLTKHYQEKERKIAKDILDFISLQEEYKANYSQLRGGFVRFL